MASGERPRQAANKGLAPHSTHANAIMPSMRTFDAFLKPVEGTRAMSWQGGLITIIASASAAFLFLSQLYLYFAGDVRHSLHLAESNVASSLMRAVPEKGREKLPAMASHNPSHMLIERRKLNLIPLSVHVTFPHIPCSDMDYSHDGASLSSGQFERLHGRGAFSLRAASRREMDLILGKAESVGAGNGCTVSGVISVPRVGGKLSVTISAMAWRRAASAFQQELMTDMIDMMTGREGAHPHQVQLPNCTHHIHSLTIGEPFPLAGDPLSETTHVIDNPSGVALHNVDVRLVPTKYKRPWRRARNTYQSSIVAHIVQPETLAKMGGVATMPGLSVSYDFTPLAVHHEKRRESMLVFLGSLISIVGGVFVTVGLVTSCIMGGVSAAVSKKSD